MQCFYSRYKKEVPFWLNVYTRVRVWTSGLIRVHLFYSCFRFCYVSFLIFIGKIFLESLNHCKALLASNRNRAI